MAHEFDNPGVLRSIAYRLLGSLGEADDAIQETYVRWYALEAHRRHDIRSPQAWLVTTLSRICLDVLKSARVRRSAYVGEWLPEPVPAQATWTSQSMDSQARSRDPQERAGLNESIGMAFLVVCASMTPAERIAFILHDVFGYRFDEIGEILGRSAQACRQLASSGRRRIRNGGGTSRPPADVRELVQGFETAWQTGDLGSLIRRLDPEATIVTDGGGIVGAILPVTGATDVARALIDVGGRAPGMALSQTVVNGQPGLIALDTAGAVLAVISMRVVDGRIDRLWVMRNPDKLTAWT